MNIGELKELIKDMPDHLTVVRRKDKYCNTVEAHDATQGEWNKDSSSFEEDEFSDGSVEVNSVLID